MKEKSISRRILLHYSTGNVRFHSEFVSEFKIPGNNQLFKLDIHIHIYTERERDRAITMDKICNQILYNNGDNLTNKHAIMPNISERF